MIRIGKILVPVNYSEPSRNALRFAATLAAPFEASIEALHVCEYPLQLPSEVNVVQDGKKRPLHGLLLENAGNEMKEFLAKADVPTRLNLWTHLTYGEPSSRILHRMKEEAFDLVVIGTHGRTGFQHFLMGSVAERVVRLSLVPVVTVPPRPAK